MSRILEAEVLVVGAGFAGSILSRCLAARGVEVLLVEKGTHPRFALGESSTPLGNLALERLALRYQLEDLYDLAAHGRWCRKLPGLMRGLKRGFTFHHHRLGVDYSVGSDSQNLMMVAASPDDPVADCQWLRADVDEYLVRKAESEGVRYLQDCEVVSLDLGQSLSRGQSSDPSARLCVAENKGPSEKGDPSEKRDTVRGQLRHRGQLVEVVAGFVVDATGSSATVAGEAGVRARRPDLPFSTRLLFSHFESWEPLEVGPIGSCALPYSPEWSAVHHLLDLGWMYELRFDDDRVSCGLVVDTRRAERLGLEVDFDSPAAELERLLSRFPSLAKRSQSARALRPIAATAPLQRRLERPVGHRWAALPHTFAFYSPLFSTGIAWSLVAVERLAEALAPLQGSQSAPAGDWWKAYGDLLEQEADHLERLLAAAYRRLDDGQGFFGVAEAYFAAASFTEACQRLREPEDWLEDSGPLGASRGWAWRGFLGATDPTLRELFIELASRAADTSVSGPELRSWIRSAIEPRNVVGLGDLVRGNLVAADAEVVVARASRLGFDQRLDPAAVARLKRRLVSPPTFALAQAEKAQGSNKAS